MPFSFTQIEKDKSSRIGFVFLFLVFFYFFVAMVLYWSAKIYFLSDASRLVRELGSPIFGGLNFREVLWILGMALVVGIAHFFISVNNVVAKVLGVLRAQPLNLADTYHNQFQNILDEVSIATGGIKVTGVVTSTSALNAFSVADFNGNNVIGVSEGLLSRLNRAQLETVVAHEMAHIVSGDCVETTVITSMFAFYGELLSNIQNGLEGSDSGRGWGLLFILWVVLGSTLFIANLIKMFISREREYRADAISVRLTRDPLSLAEALYLISHRWRGSGIPGDEMDSIFIISPQYSKLEEQEGLFSSLFSTHPPLRKRLDVLLDMAHADMGQLTFLDNQSQPKQPAPQPQVIFSGAIPVIDLLPEDKQQWEVYCNGQWRGPYTPSQMIGQGWIGYDSYVRKIGDSKIIQMFQAEEIKRYNQGIVPVSATSIISCPLCQISLTEDLYKGGPILRCPSCLGLLLYENDVQKMLARDDYFFSDHIHAVGDTIIRQQNNGLIRKIDMKSANLLFCPRCLNPKPRMLRNFFTLAYLVEVDRCITCQSIWFDRNELEILQYIIGKNSKPKT